MKTIRLTPREQEIVGLLAADGLGMSNQDIADKLSISCNNVRQHLRTVFYKMDVTSREQLARYWHCELFQIGLRAIGLIRDRNTSNGNELATSAADR